MVKSSAPRSTEFRSALCLPHHISSNLDSHTMGWFSSSSSSTTSTEATNDSAAPSRSERTACWTSRDQYFGCLDKSNVAVPGQEGDKCKKEDGEYRDKCAASWVSRNCSPESLRDEDDRQLVNASVRVLVRCRVSSGAARSLDIASATRMCTDATPRFWFRTFRRSITSTNVESFR